MVRNYETTHADGERLVADGGIQLREFVDALSDKRRRYVLYYLRSEQNAEFDDVTEQVAVWEAKMLPEGLDDQLQKNIRINLHHAQLPKLEEAGIIGYDRRRRSVCFRHPPDPVVRFLDYCASIELPDTSCVS
ncbi:DUF7344 domain-containing protein [Natronococcus wangiae]